MIIHRCVKGGQTCVNSDLYACIKILNANLNKKFLLQICSGLACTIHQDQHLMKSRNGPQMV